MSIRSNKIDKFIDSERKSTLNHLDYFKELLSNAIVLNDLGILRRDSNAEIVDQFDNDIFTDEIEELISNVYLDKKTNQLYEEILKLSAEELISDEEYSVEELNKIKMEELRLKH